MRLILPGFIDPHVHLRDPGQTNKEDFYTGTSAAIAGGYTTIIDMPNNKRPIMTLKRLAEKIKIARDKIVCDIGFYFGSVGTNMDEFPKVSQKVFGLKLFLNQTTGNYVISDRHTLESIFMKWPSDSPILLHAEDEMLDLALEIIRINPRRVHLCHIATKYELEKIMQAKENGFPITCGVTPHHLFLTESDLDHLSKSRSHTTYLGNFALMKPRLKSRKDVEFIWKHLKAVDCVESDHAPHTVDEKKSSAPPYGVPGLETTIPLLLTAVRDNRLSIEEVVRLCHEGPKKIFLLHSIYRNNQSSVEIDTDTSYEIRNEDLFTKCKWTPFNGWKVNAKIRKVIIRGQTVFNDGQIIARPGFGKVIFRKTN